MNSEHNEHREHPVSSNEGQGSPGVPPCPLPPYPPHQPPPRRFSGWRVLWGVLFGLSVLANVGLFILLIAVVAVVATGGGTSCEAVLREGPRTSKIAVINVDGIIDENQSEAVYRQLKSARDDDAVKGIIVRVNSPGGTIAASDRIYQQIASFREKEGKPAVAFMQGMAASGGYYVSVACEEIIAEPTAITGSIGVVMAHFVFEDLLQNKLGVQPVLMTMGQKKDWPSSFRKPSDEELAYIHDRLLEPAYERFVSVIEEGRKKVLSSEEVAGLADGSIFVADQAKEVELIDSIGYLDEAIARAKALAGIQKAQVIEYRTPFSFKDLLSLKKTGTLCLDRTTLFHLSTPQVLYLWNAY